MKKREDVIGKLVTVEAQPKAFAEKGVMLCPLCEESAYVEDFEWDTTDGKMEVLCICNECNIIFSARFTLNYLGHSSIYDLD